jgi:hypothetical protein
MKKLLAIMVLVMTAALVNAQRTPVKVTDLNKAITENIAKDFAGFTIKEATKVSTNNVTSYEVLVAKGSAQETLLYDKDGKYVKKVVKQEGTVEKSKAMAKQEPAKTPSRK